MLGKSEQKGAFTMKNHVTLILAFLLALAAPTACAAQAALPAPTVWAPPDSSFSSGDYARLLALRFDGYEAMTVSEFQERVWTLTDTKDYRGLLERFSKSEALYALRDTDETAAFLFGVLDPLTGEAWASRSYDGCAASALPYPSDNAVLEYAFTLTIRDADALTVGAYAGVRADVIRGMDALLSGKTLEDLRDKAAMASGIQDGIDRLVKRLQTEEIGIAIEYAYFPPSPQSGGNTTDSAQDMEQEPRRFPNGTPEDYRSLLALMTPGYENLPVADFNRALLAWANENYERMERTGEDAARGDFQVALTGEERFFVTRTVFLSGQENAKLVQSLYTGQPEEDPVCNVDLPQRTAEAGGRAAWCSLFYQYGYHLPDKSAVTVGERDQRIEAMLDAVRAFWQETDIERLLAMTEAEFASALEGIAASHSDERITLTIRSVHFERMDERARAVSNAFFVHRILLAKAKNGAASRQPLFCCVLTSSWSAAEDARSCRCTPGSCGRRRRCRSWRR